MNAMSVVTFQDEFKGRMFNGTGTKPKGEFVSARKVAGQNRVEVTYKQKNAFGDLNTIDYPTGSTLRFGPTVEEASDAVPEAGTADVEGPGASPDPTPEFEAPVTTEAPAGSEGEGLSELPEFARNLVGPGDKVYVHPQGSVIIVTPGGSIAKYGPDMKPRKTSASAAKLAVGHGQWKPVAVSKPAPEPKPHTPPIEQEPMTGMTPAEAVVIAAPEPELPSVPAPKGSQHRVPMTFNEVSVTDVPKYADDDNYVFQQKVDGIRGQLVIEPGKAPWFRSKSGERLVSSSAAKITGPILSKLGPQPTGDSPVYNVDGELLDGKWYVFDVTVEGGEKVPYADRMAMTEAWVAEMHKVGITSIQALPTARTPEEKRALWDAVNAGGGEGVMIKRRDAPYNYGQRVNHTLKAKITATADVVVLERNRGGKENAVIGVNIDGTMTEIGTVSMQGKEKFSAVQVGEVIEVKYLWAMPGSHSLQQPRFMKKRPDKKPEDAVTDQFRYVDKSVVDAGDWSTSDAQPTADAAPSAPEPTPTPPEAPPATPEATEDPISAVLDAINGRPTSKITGDPRSPEGAVYTYTPVSGNGGWSARITRTEDGWTWISEGEGGPRPLSSAHPELWRALAADEPKSFDGLDAKESWKWSERQVRDATAWYDLPTKPHPPLEDKYNKPSQRDRNGYSRALSAWSQALQARHAAGGAPTVEVRVDPASASDGELEAELARLAGVADVVRQDAAEVQDAASKRALDPWDQYISAESYKALERVMTAATPLREEMRNRLAVHTASVPEGDYDADRWDASPETTDAPGTEGTDWDALAKVRDMYVVPDKQTIDKNSQLRSGNPPAAAKAWRTKVDRWVRASVAEEDCKVFRGIAVPPSFIRSLKPGATITDPGVMSTDENEDTAKGYLDIRLGQRPDTVGVMLEILTPAGHPIVDAMFGEYVLPSRTTMTVRRITRDADGTYRVVVELEHVGG